MFVQRSSGSRRWVRGLLAAALALPAAARAAPAPFFHFEYVSPAPDSRLVSPANNIVLRSSEPLADQPVLVQATGASSGLHSGRLEVSDDASTWIFTPDVPFTPGEHVAVTVEHGHFVPDLRLYPPFQFEFDVSPRAPASSAELAIEQSKSDWPPPEAFDADPGAPPPPGVSSVPPGYPNLRLLDRDRPLPGVLCLAPFSSNPAIVGNITIVDDSGAPLFFRRLPSAGIDFKRQPDGRLTYFAGLSAATPRPQFMVMDSAYTVVDSFAAGNGYVTDSHELLFLPDGHALLMSYDPEPVRMDSVMPGGRPNAMVTGLVVQELDRAHRVVFQWRTWDHFRITDTNSPLANLTTTAVDWVHGNAIAPDLDGNLLVSFRHLSEITKIDRRTGDVIWRMGPHATQNQFTFVGDSRGFSHQHDVRRLPNGHITLFDNGNYVLPQLSRALEFEVDEAGRVARLVWERHRQPEGYGSFLGSVQRFEDGSTVIGWGGVPSGPVLTELHADGTPALDLGIGTLNTWNYRAPLFPWKTTRFRADPETLDFGDVVVGETSILPVTLANPGPDPITLNSFELSAGSGFSIVDGYPRPLGAGTAQDLHLALRALSAGPLQGTLTVAEITPTELIARRVTLVGNAVNAAPKGWAMSASAARAGGGASALAARTENPVRGVTTVRYALPSAGRATLEIFGVDGARRATLVDADQAAGEHAVAWDPAGLPGGVYFCRLTAGGGSVTTRFARVR